MKTRVIAVVIALLVADTGFCQGQKDLQVLARHRQIKHAICQVRVHWPCQWDTPPEKLPEPKACATGFVIDSYTVVTVWHVYAKAPGLSATRTSIRFFDQPNDPPLWAHDIKTQKDDDITFIAFRYPVFRYRLEMARQISDRERAVMVGKPGFGPLPMRVSGWATQTQGQIYLRFLPDEPYHARNIPGNSGAPLLNAQGRVIGMLINGPYENCRLKFLPSDAIWRHYYDFLPPPSALSPGGVRFLGRLLFFLSPPRKIPL